MPIPLGTYDSEGSYNARLRFEKGRKSALGIVQGITGAGLNNADRSLEAVRRQFGRQEREDQRYQPVSGRFEQGIDPLATIRTAKGLAAVQPNTTSGLLMGALDWYQRTIADPVIAGVVQQRSAAGQAGGLGYGGDTPGTVVGGDRPLQHPPVDVIGAVRGNQAAQQGAQDVLGELDPLTRLYVSTVYSPENALPVVGFAPNPLDVAEVAGPRLIAASRRHAAELLANQEILTLYHGTEVDIAKQIEKQGLNPGSGLTTNRQIAELFAKNNFGENGTVLEFRIPRNKVRNPSPAESWYVVADEPRKPVTGIRRIATEVGGTKLPDEEGGMILEPGGPVFRDVPEERAIAEAAARREATPRGRLEKLIADLEERIANTEEAGRDTSALEYRLGELDQQLEDLPPEAGPGTYAPGPEYNEPIQQAVEEVPEIEEIDELGRPKQLVEDLQAVLRGEKKASPKPQGKRGQYLGPALRRTLREAGYTKEEIEALSRIPPVSGGAEPVDPALTGPVREAPSPATAPSPSTAPSPTRPGGAPQFGPGQPPPPRRPTALLDAEEPSIPPSTGATQERLLPGFDDPAVQSILDKATQDARLISATESLLEAGAARRRFAGAAAAISGTPPGTVGQLAEQRFILQEAIVQHTGNEVLAQAVSEKFFMDEVIRRFGTKTKGKPGYKPLFKGYQAPEQIVDWARQVRRPVGDVARTIENLAGVFKNTVFGVGDLAVAGVQFPLSLAQGGFQLGIGTLNRSLELMHLPYIRVLLEDPEYIKRATQFAQDGVHEGLGPASIHTKTGTLVKYIPFVGKYIDKPIQVVVDGLARIQFGIVLTALRNRIHEGNLIALSAIGRDITDPAVRRLSAEWANGLTGASRGAQVTGRRSLETTGLTSFQMGRSQLAVLGSLVKGLGPKASAGERLRTALTLANIGAYVYGLQYLVNKQFGSGPMEWVPGKPDWATIKVSGQTVPIIPNRSLLRAIERSVEYLASGQEQDIPRAWTQLAVSRASPLVQAPLSLAGFGFEPGTGRFRAGDLSQKGRLTGIIPAPPIAETAAFESTSPEVLALSAAGFNPYTQQASQQLFDIPRYRGIDNKTVSEVYEFLDRVQTGRREAIQRGIPQQKVLDTPVEHNIRELAIREGKGREFTEWAVRLNKNPDDPQVLNREWLYFIIEHEDELRSQTPWIFDQWMEEFLRLNRGKALAQ